MSNEKQVNYTVEQTAELVEAYNTQPTAETVAAFAEKFGKSVKSVVAKLSREGVYKRKEYVTKKGEKPVSKEELVAEIAGMLNVSAEALVGLEKANKSTLTLILGGFHAVADEAAAEFAEAE